jgi:glutaconate CoA-transferase subunit B
MILLATQPGISITEVLDNTGFDLLVAEQVQENPPPSSAELRILREEVDKDRLYI